MTVADLIRALQGLPGDHDLRGVRVHATIHARIGEVSAWCEIDDVTVDRGLARVVVYGYREDIEGIERVYEQPGEPRNDAPKPS